MVLNDLIISEIELSFEETNLTFGGDLKIGGDPLSRVESSRIQRTGCDGHDPVGCDQIVIND